MITTDKGFAYHRGEAHAGILIIRLRQPNELKIHERVMRGVEQLTEDEWTGTVVVMRDVVQSIWRII